jgi:inhibitor of the pro-sigma K processing machinery
MRLIVEANTIITYLACIFFLLIIGRIFILPLKSILKLIVNSVLGGILIYIINLIGGIFSFHIGLNIGTAIIVGILGIPRSDTTYSFIIFFVI